MKIQQPNKTNPASRGLYFVKTRPVCNQYFNYKNITEQKVTSNGIKYIEDTFVKSDVKSLIAQIPFVKRMAKIRDIFIVYEELKTPKLFNEKNKEYRSSIDMYIADNDNINAERYIFQGRDDFSLENARKKCINIIMQKSFNKGVNNENPNAKCI